MRALALLSLLSLAAAPAPPPPASPDETPGWAVKYLGVWDLYEDGEGAPACQLKFVRGMSIGGAALQLSPTCRRNFPLEEVAGWTVLDHRKGRPSIQFIDALRKPVFTFAPAMDDLWSSTLPDREGLPRGGFLLARGKPDPVRSVRQLLGGGEAYNLSGPNAKDWCGFATTATGAASGKLTQEGHCAKRWKGRGWATWEVSAGELKLKDRKGAVVVSLRRGDALTFQGGTADDPLFFGPGAIQES